MLYDAILANAQAGIGIATALEIDELNILGATMLAMQCAAEALLPAAPTIALVDGNRAPKLSCKVKPWSAATA